MNAPFGSAYCIVAPHSASLDHVNQPADEDELFIGIEGKAVVIIGDEEFEVTKGDQVFIPQGVRHFVRNDSDTPFHFYTIWWNDGGVESFTDARKSLAIHD
ncbi:cupin domain-containing protein [Pantoea sp. Cy-639]|uniref:cupin domain-containing protein n=1 Tax=Pantoea sp. Cy-639 TaxID=2608360 RepID=UPI00141E583D|nr:cupin domain-containing protein [Pantoea sp. Cy-639]